MNLDIRGEQAMAGARARNDTTVAEFLAAAGER